MFMWSPLKGSLKGHIGIDVDVGMHIDSDMGMAVSVNYGFL